MDHKILVIDDDEWVRRLLQDLFQESGFKVMEAGDGESACVLFSRHAEEIDLVTLDMDMPGLDGVETFHRLREIRPEIKVVILSGSPRYQGFNPPRVPRVDKPFSTDRLLNCVRSMVG